MRWCATVWGGGGWGRGASSCGLGDSSESSRATAWVTRLGYQRGKKTLLNLTLIRLCEMTQQTDAQFEDNQSNVLCVHVHASFMPTKQQLHHRCMDVSSKIEGKIGSRIGSGGQGTWQMARGHMLNKCYYLLYMKEIINYIWVEQLTVCTPFCSFIFASDDTWVVIRWWWYQGWWYPGNDIHGSWYTERCGESKKGAQKYKNMYFLEM